MLRDQRFLELWRLTKSYPGPRGPAVIVRDVSLLIPRGEFVCLLGHSGCGKSTVLSMVAGLTSITSGAVVIDSKEIDGTGLDRGVVFQAPCLLPWLSALENVALAVSQAKPELSKSERQQIALDYLGQVGLADEARKLPRELSSGMRQRVGIARAFSLQPKVLLLDEPFGMLDCVTRMELQETLLSIWTRERQTALMVTHDVDEAILLADKIAMMTNGPEAEIGEVIEVPFARPRERAQILNDPLYFNIRERVLGFLESQERGEAAAVREIESPAEIEAQAANAEAAPIGAAEPEPEALAEEFADAADGR